MRTFITPNPSTPTGYEVTVKHDDGRVEHLPVEKTVLEKKTGINWLVLPENPCNRKLLNPAKMVGKSELELSVKEAHVNMSTKGTTPKAPTKGWVEYLTDEEKALYEDLKAKAERRAQIAKLKAQKAEWERQLAELEAQE